jgi:hypothetical protein
MISKPRWGLMRRLKGFLINQVLPARRLKRLGLENGDVITEREWRDD